MTDPRQAPASAIERLRRSTLVLSLAPLAAGALLAIVLSVWGGDAADAARALRWLAIALLGLLALAAAVAFPLINRWATSLAEPLARLRETLGQLVAGDLAARSGLGGADEAGAIGRQLDTFLDERVAALERASRDSEELNDSVIEIMQAVGTIATTKDLTMKVPVTENVTGAIADALNLLTDETRRVLISVRDVSGEVARGTVEVRSQSESAGQAAQREQREVDLAARELAAAAGALGAIAERARGCNDAAERAVIANIEAMRSVGSTVQGIGRSRALIRETEKRIKRLGERSQEIGQVVGLIQGIAERTGILALNASMRAANAGEAGRSFLVVADEVKRLSESARDATSQISRLIAAIQAETTDTVVAMNQAITQVVEISRLAEEAGVGMRNTQEETEALAANVRDIARTSSEQSKVGAALQERARIIQEASGETARQLALQAEETQRLVERAQALLGEIGAFKVSD